MADRQELIRNAVSFLSDPKASSFAQRVQFLEAKGLTPPEIDLAVKQAATTQYAPIQQQNYSQGYGPSPYNVLPVPLQRPWDWRDYFITAVISGSVAYGAVSLFKKYLLPHLQPPATTAYEGDRDALTAQFDAAEALLKEIQDETVAIRTAVDKQTQKVEKTTEDVALAVAEMRQGEAKTRDEMREIREEVNNVREMLPKMMEKNKDSQTHSLTELQQELKSLKALLLSRGPGASSTPASPMPILTGRPTIPAWQLSASPGSAQTVPATPPQIPTLPSPGVNNGKGKELET